MIMGCGRVGSLLAERFDAGGHTVAVVDQDAKAFRRLPDTFRGDTVTGVGFDRETPEIAGIQRASAFAAVSNGDNSNILAARVARENYSVEHVVARIYDPRRAEIYERLGIPTVATVGWTTGQIMRRILPMGAEEDYRDSTGTVSLCEVHLGPGWVGRKVAALQTASTARVAYVNRYGQPILVNDETVLQDGDLVHALFSRTEQDYVERVFAEGPKE